MMQTEAMSHEEVDAHEIVELYVAGKLSALDEARFEEHYLGCPPCQQAIEDAERLRRGLHGVAAQQIAQTAVLATALRLLRTGPGALLATLVLVLVLLPAGLARQQVGRLGTELESVSAELDALRRPRANTPILTLVPTRDVNPPASLVSLGKEPEWIVFAIPIGNEAAPSYGVTLTRAGGEIIWPSATSKETLEPSYDGTLTFSLLSSLLPPGEYLLELRAAEDAPPATAKHLKFPLRIVASDS